MMSLPIEADGKTFKWGTATVLFPAPYANFLGTSGARNYDLSPDGRRFLTVKNPSRQPENSLVVVENWFEELKQIVPTNRD